MEEEHLKLALEHDELEKRQAAGGIDRAQVEKEHNRMVAEHDAIKKEHDQIVAEHKKMLAEHK
jgi:hypothetical protein